MTYEESVKRSQKVDYRSLVDYLEKVFPDWLQEVQSRKRVRKHPLVTIFPCDSTTSYNMNWEGGSKRTYRLIRLDGMDDPRVDEWNANAKKWAQTFPGENTQDGKKLDTVEGYTIAVHSYFCGKDSGITFYVHPNEKTKF